MELFTSTPKKNMYIHLYRNQPQGNAITGRLVIDGRWFCDTLERKGYQILPLCYHVAVTQSPKFKRLLPIVQNVPQRSGIRIHRGTKPEHSTGCILVVADNSQPLGCGLISPDGSNDRSAYVPQRNVVDVVVNNAPCIYFVAITPSGHGLRIIAERQEGESLIAAQTRLANLCGFAEYDAVTHDLARASFLMPWSYVLYCEPLGLDFTDEAHFNKIQRSGPTAQRSDF